MNLKIYSDLRWPSATGIGLVKEEIIKRLPHSAKIIDLKLRTRIGSPLSPFEFGWALRHAGDVGGVAWSAGFIPPYPTKVPSVVTVHDLTHLHFYSSLHREYYKKILRPLYKRCARVICVSKYSRDEFVSWSGIDEEKVSIVFNGVSDIFHENLMSAQFDFPYIFYPGNKRNYKNLARLIAAFAQSSLADLNFHLVMTGSPCAELERLSHTLGIKDRLLFAGVVSVQRLAELYRGAAFVSFVSLYEGFGLPILEAMASNTPVLTSNCASMPEIAGGAALIVDPLSVESIALGMRDLAEDGGLRSKLVELGAARVKEFSWDKCAKKTWQLVSACA